MNASNLNLLSALNRDCLSQPKILLVEDCPVDEAIMRRILSNYFPLTLVDHSATKFEALERLRNNTYDFIILDLNLPDTKDLSDIKEFRLMNLDTFIIIVTGNMDEESCKAAKEHCADGIIHKNNLTKIDFSGIVERAVDNVTQL